jgi:putative phage-type endonuclease
MSSLVNAEQGSEGWRLARVPVATASNFSKILSRTKNGYGADRANYLAEKTLEIILGKPQETYKSEAMRWGTDNEPTARLEYELLTGNDVEETGLWIHDTIKAGASPDGFVNKDGLLEIKCPMTATHIQTLKTKTIPKAYIAQVQGQMWITGRKWCDFVSYDPRLPENAQMIIIRVERNEPFIKELELEVAMFMAEVNEQVKFIKEYK